MDLWEVGCDDEEWIDLTMAVLDKSGNEPLGSLKVKLVPRCGPGGSMCTCHVAGLGSIPGQDKFPGVFPHLYDKSWQALGPQHL